MLENWHIGGIDSSDVQLWSADRGVVVDHVQRLARETIRREGVVRQGLHVWYADSGQRREAVVEMNEALTLRAAPGRRLADKPRGGPEGVSRSSSVPILPAREYLCNDLLSPDGAFLSVGAAGTLANRNGSGPEAGNRCGARMAVGNSLGAGLDVALAVEALSVNKQLLFPVSIYIRSWPFGGRNIESVLHYIPSVRQFMEPGSSALRPPKSVCTPGGTSGNGDSTVYVVEERRFDAPPFIPFFYFEAGLVFNGVSTRAVNVDGSWLNTQQQLMGGIGVGAPVIGPFVASLGYRYTASNIHAFVITLTAEFR